MGIILVHPLPFGSRGAIPSAFYAPQAMWLAKLRAGGGGATLPPRELRRRHTPLLEAPNPRDSSADSGLFLKEYCEFITNIAVRRNGRPQLPDKSKGRSLRLRCGSLFTGSVSDACAFDAAQSALQGEAVDVEFDWEFHCDVDPAKRSFAEGVHAALKGLSPKEAKEAADSMRMPCSLGDVGTFGR